MSSREGSLEAPTRHAVDWKNPQYYDQDACFTEMERVFDACHGCRRCVSLCNSFPTLFDLVDESSTLEVDGVKKEDYWKVVDQCYLCDVCYVTKCPYVPPHPWNIDFPHLMLRAKAIQFKQGTDTQKRDVTLSNTDRNGKLASIPVVVKMVNALNKNESFRGLLENQLGVHKQAWVPEFTSKKFVPNAKSSTSMQVIEGKRSRGKVAIYSTCYVNYNEPGIGHDLIKVLEHNQIPYVVVQKAACCGMPKFELGDLDTVEKLKDQNMPELDRLASEGYAIMTPIPSCTLMFKQEIPLLFANDERAQRVKQAMVDPFEYLMNRLQDGLLKTDFNAGLGNVSYHIACHLRVQNVGQKTRELLEKIPNTHINTIERCSGHAGTWGVKKEFHDMAMKIGRPVVRQMSEHPEGPVQWIASDCQLAAHHIEQGMKIENDNKVAHPLTLLRMAYGLPE
jgi:glycerol-3-phosphate dehydrogenase subunit C